MFRRALTNTTVGFAALCSSLFAGGSAAQTAAVDTFSNFAWRGISASTCTNRAAQSVGAAIAAFAVTGANFDTNNYRVLAQTDELNVFIYCFADDNTPAFDGAGASRVLVAIYVSTSRGTIGGAIRDFLAGCMETGACPAGAAAPARLKP